MAFGSVFAAVIVSLWVCVCGSARRALRPDGPDYLHLLSFDRARTIHGDPRGIFTWSMLCLDSGASSCHSRDLTLLHNVRAIPPRRVSFAGGAHQTVEFAGDMKIRGPNSRVHVLPGVLYSPFLSQSYLSVSRLTDRGFELSFTRRGCKLKTAHGTGIGEIFARDGLYFARCQVLRCEARTESEIRALVSKGLHPPDPQDLPGAQPSELPGSSPVPRPSPSVASQLHAIGSRTDVVDIATAHRRLLHLCEPNIRSTIKSVDGLELKPGKLPPGCPGCAAFKLSKTAHGRNPCPSRAVAPGIRTHSDYKKLRQQYRSKTGFVIFLDDASSFVTGCLVASKKEAREAYRRHCAFMLIKTHRDPEELICDGGGEYVAEACLGWAKDHGQLVRPTAADTPQMDARAERFIRCAVEAIETATGAANLPLSLSALALGHFIWIHNRTSHSSAAVTPLEALTGERPNLAGLVTYGSVGYALPSVNRRDPSERVRFIGMAERHGVYLCLAPSGRIVRRDTVRWYDGVFRFDGIAPSIDAKVNLAPSFDAKVDPASPAPTTRSEAPSPPAPRSLRASRGMPPARMGVNYLISDDLLRDVFPSGVLESKLDLIHETLLSAPDVDSDAIEPTNYRQAIRDPTWHGPMAHELDTLHTKGCFEIVDRSDHPLISSLWVCKVKRASTGAVTRLRARLTAMGNRMVAGRDHDQAYAPTVRSCTLRLFLAIALTYNLIVTSVDFSSAFVNAELDRLVYMRLPPGYHLSEHLRHLDPSRHCIRLRKSLYGCVQAARLWYLLLVKVLTGCGLSQSKSDPCLFFLSLAGRPVLLVIVYVDDLAIASADPDRRDRLVAHLGSLYALRDEGPLGDFLGLSIQRTKLGYRLSQEHYVRSLLSRFGMESAHATSTPMVCGVKLDADDSPPLSSEERSTYKSLIGALLFVSGMSRPDISLALSKLCRYVSAPRQLHLSAAKRVLRYLKGSAAEGIEIRPCPIGPGGVLLCGHCDASHADGPGARSTAGYFFTLGTSTIMWSARLQTFVAFSTTEAECATACACLRDGEWLLCLLHELQVPVRLPVNNVANDNRGAVEIAVADRVRHRTKTCRIHFHLVRDLVLSGSFRLSHVSSADNPADALTKALPRATYIKHRSRLLGSS